LATLFSSQVSQVSTLGSATRPGYVAVRRLRL
jgi:hypothetical protein